MSTLVKLLLAMVANVLSLTGIAEQAPTSSNTVIMQCEYQDQLLNNHIIIKNEQLSQKIN